jgi:DNA-binding Lrp family transcriptional regulator
MAEEAEELRMRDGERQRLKVLHEVSKRHITQAQAGKELGISARWVRELGKRIKERGDGAVVHGLRGKRSNRRLGEKVKARALQVFAAQKQARQWHDYGPTLAAEELGSEYGVKVGKETLRQWLLQAGLWKARRARVERVHVWRKRRARWGELVQWDTSTHDWLEGRGQKLYLIALLDDATSRAEARLVSGDSTEENMRTLRAYLEAHGRPLAVYTDKASLFQTAAKAAHHREAPVAQPTQIGRALQELGIEWIAAHSPQAKGRVERFFGTAQDRLVKGLRKVGADNLEQANRYLEQVYLPLWNRRFAREAEQAGDAHRALDRGQLLDSVLSRMETRAVAQDYTVRWAGAAYQIRRADISGGMRGRTVEIEQRLDGTVWMRWKQRRLPLDRCAIPTRASYRAPWTPPQAARKPDAAQRQQRREQAQARSNQAFQRLPERPLWQAMRS